MASGLGPWLAAYTHILRQNPHFGRSAHSKFFVWEILNRIWIPNACTNSGSDQTPHRTLESRIPKSIHILVSDQTPSQTPPNIEFSGLHIWIRLEMAPQLQVGTKYQFKNSLKLNQLVAEIRAMNCQTVWIHSTFISLVSMPPKLSSFSSLIVDFNPRSFPRYPRAKLSSSSSII